MHRPFIDRTWARRPDTRILVALLLVTAGLAGFAYVASEVMEGHPLAIDRWLLLLLRQVADPGVSIGPRWFGQAMLDLTALGGGTVLTLVTIFVTGYLAARRKLALAAFVAGSIGSGAVLTALLKIVFARARPDIVPHLVEVSSASFPSGHAMNSAMVYLTGAALLASAEPDRRVRVFLITAALLLTLSIGFSRVFLGVHFPTDVLAGWAIGIAWAVAASWVAAILQRRQAIEGAEGTTTSTAP
ncbi:phosphatase PAP2 family protein [Sphingomonas yantingensis]|uniref:Undecaprenyl-diphosphatase n=1 Tax=Sphingomonas yantingensis TaxID=1241761 RepID=A0A7W9EGA0_9SPHN|nr:phosphatase PAP2 family protein [Sphingomonas yantingensis]MBB5696882.1 undecaprenyl-diphosphatase [Sphingomonas yantingensis]